MPRIHAIYSKACKELDSLIQIESQYQTNLSTHRAALNLSIEYIFLCGYKTWEKFLESVFISQSRYNDPVSGKRPYPFLDPRTEKHAHELIKLEKDYIDWTSPDSVVSRAEILFRNSKIITDPIKSSMQDLRDAKRVRNHIAHESQETLRLFDDLTMKRLGKKFKTAGNYLLSKPSGNNDHYAIFYINKFKQLVTEISN